MLEMFTGWESANKYRVFNTLGQDVFFAREDNDCCTRMCCGPGRPFEMEIVDNSGREIIHLVRPLRCQGCCFPCCLQVILTTLSVDQIVLIDIDIDVDTYRICCKKSIKSISNNLGLLNITFILFAGAGGPQPPGHHHRVRGAEVDVLHAAVRREERAGRGDPDDRGAAVRV